jgi:H+-transporting ATPase
VLSRLAGGLWAPVPWMLEATIVLELVLGKWLDAAIVGAVLVFNAGLGFVQQQRAAAALELINDDSPVAMKSFVRPAVWSENDG